MATIEEVLGARPEDIAAMTDDNPDPKLNLKIYLKDITNLEPKTLPPLLGSKKVVVGEEDEGEDGDIPIKLRKPRAKAGKIDVSKLKGVFDD